MPSSKQVDHGITLCFAAGVGILLYWTLAHGIWWGTLFDGNRTSIIHLAHAPVWSPPEPPSYAEFRKVFSDLPEAPVTGAVLGVELKWDFMLAGFFVYFFPLCLLFAGISLVNQAECRTLGVHLIRWIAVSLAVSAAICIVLWMVFGGWGPPSPAFFGFLGLIVGIWLGVNRWSRPSAEQPQR